jgi:hypothetical protein
MKQVTDDKFVEAYKNLTEDNFSAPWKFSRQAKVLMENLNKDKMIWVIMAYLGE